MFQWYQDAEFCIVYMSDVLEPHVSSSIGSLQFETSRYWRRGWTLQELIVPERAVVFFGHGWNYLGTREGLVQSVSTASKIPEEVLLRTIGLFECSIAQRMSWASRRDTTRTEDIAYSLLGLFNINMPLLYGEGAKAFVRLQEEILKDSADQTIFAWSDTEELDGSTDFLKTRNRLELRGVLAIHPRYFARSTGFCSKPMEYREDLARREITSTNLGLKMSVPVWNCEYFIVAELTVIAIVPSEPNSILWNASSAPSGNHVCIILWPEPGGKGRLMRVMHTACILRSQISNLHAAVDSPSVHLLKTNHSRRHYVKTDLIIGLRNLPNHVIDFQDCLHAPFPVSPLTILKATGSHHKWSFWEPSIVSETVVVLKIHIPAFNLHIVDKSRSPHKGFFLLLLWLDPVLKCHCYIVPAPEGSDQYADITLDTLFSKLSTRASLDVPEFGAVSFECQQSGVGSRVTLVIEGDSLDIQDL